MVVVALARLGAHDLATSATTVAACFKGILLHRIARHDETDPRPTFELVARAALDRVGVVSGPTLPHGIPHAVCLMR